jgi:hypothetical protein
MIAKVLILLTILAVAYAQKVKNSVEMHFTGTNFKIFFDYVDSDDRRGSLRV